MFILKNSYIIHIIFYKGPIVICERGLEQQISKDLFNIYTKNLKGC